MHRRVLIVDDEENIREMSDFSWNDGNTPANGRLTLRAVEREALEKAARKEVGK